MGELLLYVVVALTVAAIVFGVTVMIGGGDPGLGPVEPDGRALPLPGDRPLGEEDVVRTRFDTALRGYRMSQVDQALQRAAYDIGYKGELIGVLEAEVAALREGRTADADVLRRAREAAVAPPPSEPVGAGAVQVSAGEPSGGMAGGISTPVSDDPAAVVAGVPPHAATAHGTAHGPTHVTAHEPAHDTTHDRAHGPTQDPAHGTTHDRALDTTPADGPAARPAGDAAPVER